MNFKGTFKTLGKVKDTNPGVLKNIKKIADEHMPEILCVGSGVALVLTGIAAFRASKNVVKVSKRYEEKTLGIDADNSIDEEERKEQKKEARISRDIQYVLAYKWVFLFGALSFGCSFASNQISGSKIAGLTVALAASEDKLKKFAASVKNKLGEDEFKDIRDNFRKEVLGEQLKDEAPFDVSKKSGGDAEVLIFDTYLMAPFWGNPEQVKDAIDLAEDYIGRNHVLNFNKWRGFIGLPDCPAGGNAEWNPMNPFAAKLGTIIVDGDEFLAIEYEGKDGKECMPSTKRLSSGDYRNSK